MSVTYRSATSWTDVIWNAARASFVRANAGVGYVEFGWDLTWHRMHVPETDICRYLRVAAAPTGAVALAASYFARSAAASALATLESTCRPTVVSSRRSQAVSVSAAAAAAIRARECFMVWTFRMRVPRNAADEGGRPRFRCVCRAAGETGHGWPRSSMPISVGAASFARHRPSPRPLVGHGRHARAAHRRPGAAVCG